MNSDETKNLKALMILEVLGRPPEHLTSTLNDLIKQMDEEKGVVVKSKDVKEPVPMKEKVGSLEKGGKENVQVEGFYSSFAEIELEVETVMHLAMLMFKYMPAHIEIISPESVALTNNGWNEILNELTRRLHGYDEVARTLQVEKEILERKLRDLIEGKKEENN